MRQQKFNLLLLQRLKISLKGVISILLLFIPEGSHGTAIAPPFKWSTRISLSSISHPKYYFSEVRWGRRYSFGADPNHPYQTHWTDAGILRGQTFMFCHVIQLGTSIYRTQENIRPAYESLCLAIAFVVFHRAQPTCMCLCPEKKTQ